MTQTAQGPVGPVIYNVYVNGVLYNNQPPIMDAQLVEEFGMHDLFILRIEWPINATQTLAAKTLWPDDTPILIQWGRTPDINVWYGYENPHEINSAADSGTNMMQV